MKAPEPWFLPEQSAKTVRTAEGGSVIQQPEHSRDKERDRYTERSRRRIRGKDRYVDN